MWKNRELLEQHLDPLVLHILKLQKMAKDHNVPDVIKEQIDRCMRSYFARDSYCESTSLPPSEALTKLTQETLNHPWQQLYDDGKTGQWNLSPIMMSGVFEGALLKTLVSMTNSKKLLEIGLFTGSSALSMAEALPPDGSLVTCEISPYLCQLARQLLDESPHGKKVIIKEGPAFDTLTELADKEEKFDFIFIDADKPGYLSYYKVIMDRGMLKPGGTIAVDNALFQGVPYSQKEDVRSRELVNGAAIKEFNEYVKADERVLQVLIPIRDGLMLVRRKEDILGSV